MLTLSDWPAAAQAIGQHFYTRMAALPDGVQTLLTSAFTRVSPVERAALYCETLYASAALFEDQDRELCGALGHFLGHPDRAMWGMHIEERGVRIFAAMRRMNGEDGAEQPQADDPAPLPQYVVTPVEAEA